MNTLLIWTYDEHGGYYDHVPPPAALTPDDIPPAITDSLLPYNGFAQYSFRVPFAIISPYSRPAPPLDMLDFRRAAFATKRS